MPVDLGAMVFSICSFVKKEMEHGAAPKSASVADQRKLVAATTADSESRSVLPFEIDDRRLRRRFPD